METWQKTANELRLILMENPNGDFMINERFQKTLSRWASGEIKPTTPLWIFNVLDILVFRYLESTLKRVANSQIHCFSEEKREARKFWPATTYAMVKV